MCAAIEVSGADLLSDRKLQGSNMGSNHFRVDMPRFVDFYLAGKLKLDDPVGAPFGLTVPVSGAIGYALIRHRLPARTVSAGQSS